MKRFRAPLLLIDDDRALAECLLAALPVHTDDLLHAVSSRDAMAYLARVEPSTILLEHALPDAAGLDVLSEIQRVAPASPVLFLTTQATATLTVPAMQRGAFDCLRKPLEIRHLRRRIRDAQELFLWRSGQRTEASVISPSSTGLVGTSEAMQPVFKTMGQLAPLSIPLLILGEPGTGKETIALSVYRHSRWAHTPLIRIHAPTAPLDEWTQFLAALEAQGTRPATFLCESIDAAPPFAQTRLVQAIDHQWTRPTDGTYWRLIATSECDSRSLLAHNHFRADLAYRLLAGSIALPPLRQRRDDVPDLIAHFAKEFERQALPKPFGESFLLDTFVDECFDRYSWPGNLDELQHVLMRLRLEGRASVVSTPPPRSGQVAPGSSSSPSLPYGIATPLRHTDWQRLFEQAIAVGSEDIYQTATLEMDAKIIGLVMQHTRGNLAQAARLLGITRVSLRKKLRQLPSVRT